MGFNGGQTSKGVAGIAFELIFYGGHGSEFLPIQVGRNLMTVDRNVSNGTRNVDFCVEDSRMQIVEEVFVGDHGRIVPVDVGSVLEGFEA